jgi:predicted small metal-binding protein
MKLECDCGFLVGSHDGGEVLELSIMHVRQKHGQTFSKDDVRKK